jgi:hypothetical protein
MAAGQWLPGCLMQKKYVRELNIYSIMNEGMRQLYHLTGEAAHAQVCCSW